MAVGNYTFLTKRAVREGSNYPVHYKSEKDRLLAEKDKLHLKPIENAGMIAKPFGDGSWGAVFGNYRNLFLISVIFAGFDYDTKVAIVLTILTVVSNVVSIVLSPIVGVIVARTRTKLGKYRPYGLLVMVPYALCAALMFYNPPGLDYTGKIAWVSVTLAIYTALGTIAGAAGNLMQVMTPNDKERGKWIGLSGIVSTVASVFPLVIYKVLSIALGTNIYLIIAIIFAVVLLTCSFIFYGFGKERVIYNPEKVKVTTSMFEGFKHKPFVIFYATTCLRLIAGLTGVTTPYLAGVVMGEENIIIFSLASGAGTGFGLVLCNLLMKKIRPVIMMRFIGFYSLVVAVLLVIIGPFGGIPFYICYFLYGITYGFHNVLPSVITADINDYLEWKTGQRIEASASVLVGYIQKAVTILRDMLFPFMLVWAGFKGAAYEGQSVLEANAANRESTASILMLYAVGIPGVFFFLMSVLYFFYDLDGEKKELMRRELQVMRAEHAERAALAAQNASGHGDGANGKGVVNA